MMGVIVVVNRELNVTLGKPIVLSTGGIGHVYIGRTSRDAPPAHYTLKIDSFSQLLQILSDTGIENYESNIFEASGYKWKLSLYPNGDKKENGEEHISLYLVIAETELLPVGWEVKVKMKMFVYDKVHNNYSIFKDNKGKIRHFNESMTESGFTNLLPLSVFKDPSNGYLIRDKCMFGVEVFVLNYSGRGECVPLQEKVNATHTWRIDNFSYLEKKCYYSDGFTLGNCQWKLQIYPRGDKGSKGEDLSLYLNLKDTDNDGKVCANYRLRIRDQLHGNHKEKTSKNWCTTNGWGWTRFLTLSDLYKPSKGFLLKDSLIVEVEIISISCVKKFPQS